MRERSWEDANPNREVELYAAQRGQMYATPSSVFNFKAYGRQLYAMPYMEAAALNQIITKTEGLLYAIQTLRAFRQQLSLAEATDIIKYLATNFRNL